MSAWDTIANEFADVRDTDHLVQIIVRMAAAAVLGGVLGLEREVRRKPAGVRTHMLVALASAVIVLLPQQAGHTEESLSRVIQGLLAGIGLLCAGSILKSSGEEGHVRGLTTSAGVWMTAAIGVAVGMGRLGTAVLATLLALAILVLEEPLHRLLGTRDKA
jgi:putative Mg2+ transporter-C (MgtC) family protein